MPQTTSCRTLWRATAVAVASLCLAACAPHTQAQQGVINVVAAENQYGSVVSQLGGPFVHVTSILNNPNADPHSFEASTRLAQDIANAQLVVQNGLGYDTFMNQMEAATPNAARVIVSAQRVLGLPDSTPNPHLWYADTTMPAVARAITQGLITLAPQHRAYFLRAQATFQSSLNVWQQHISAFARSHHGVRAAVTEPVADYLLQELGVHIVTPFSLQRDIMNGIDPAPQDISLEDGLFTRHTVRLFCYNVQVVSPLTLSIRSTATSSHIPTVAVYETMPLGDAYQQWMMQETVAIEQAVTAHHSTEKLP
jgi:zinc/manganese transport system substrate-binding protein